MGLANGSAVRMAMTQTGSTPKEGRQGGGASAYKTLA